MFLEIFFRMGKKKKYFNVKKVKSSFGIRYRFVSVRVGVVIRFYFFRFGGGVVILRGWMLEFFGVFWFFSSFFCKGLGLGFR